MNLQFERELGEIPVRIGIIQARNIDMGYYPEGLNEEIQREVAGVRDGLDEQRDAMRQACRDMLRNGKYKPTGRAKPSSEYLLREASNDRFPAINPVVDINNLISLRYMIPISLWDVDRAESTTIRFRLGTEGEALTFNSSGQQIEVVDLVTGFAVTEEKEYPIINPVKDALATKMDEQTTTAGIAVYYPIEQGTMNHLQHILDDFSSRLEQVGEDVGISTGMV